MTTQTHTITPVVHWHKKSKGICGTPAGWRVYDRNSGVRLSPQSIVYTTEQEALNAAQGHAEAYLAQQQRRAEQREQQTTEQQTTERTESDYTEVHSSLYGRGRRYHAQPGATQYQDGFGGYGVQIWDNS